MEKEDRYHGMHTQECWEYAAQTARDSGRAYCIVQCADARTARLERVTTSATTPGECPECAGMGCDECDGTAAYPAMPPNRYDERRPSDAQARTELTNEEKLRRFELCFHDIQKIRCKVCAPADDLARVRRLADDAEHLDAGDRAALHALLRRTSDATHVGAQATEVPYPPSSVGALDERETLERLCNLLSRVWNHFDPHANDPNDCFCHKRTFGPDKFRSSGRPLRWVEDVVIAALERVTNSDPSRTVRFPSHEEQVATVMREDAERSTSATGEETYTFPGVLPGTETVMHASPDLRLIPSDATDEKRISVDKHDLGYRLNLPNVWRAGVLVNAEEAKDLTDALLSAQGRSTDYALPNLAEVIGKAVDAARLVERRSVVAWLRTTPRAGGVLIGVESSQDIARLASDLESGAWCETTQKRSVDTAKGDGT